MKFLSFSNENQMKKKDRLLILSISRGYGGAERAIELMLEEIKDSFLSVHIFVGNRNHYELLSKIFPKESKRITCVPPGRSVFSFAIILWRVFFTIFIFRPTAILTNTCKSALIIALLSPLLFRIKLFAYIRDFQWKYMPLIRQRIGTKITFLIPSISIIDFWPLSYGPISICTKINDILVSDAGEKFIVLPDNSPLTSADDATDDNKTKWDLICLGYFSKLKGLHILVDAIKSITSESPEVRALILGDFASDDYYSEIVTQINLLSLDNNIYLQPAVEDPSHYIKQSKIVVSASIPHFGGPETFGKTIVEGWAYAKPAVATACGGPNYLIRNGVDGLLVEPGDSEDLACKIKMLLNSPSYAKQLGKNGYNTFCEKYTTQAVGKRLLHIIST